jgi:hypothetical protein
VLSLIQQPAIVVEVIKQPAVTPDASVDAVLAMFMLAGVAMLLAAIGGLLGGVVFVGIRRFRDASAPPADQNPLRLRI